MVLLPEGRAPHPHPCPQPRLHVTDSTHWFHCWALSPGHTLLWASRCEEEVGLANQVPVGRAICGPRVSSG